MIVRQPPWDAAGRIQADNVSSDPTSSDSDGGTRTRSSLPSKRSALPYRPRVQVAPVTVPTLPLPESSATEAPTPLVERIRRDQPDRVRAGQHVRPTSDRSTPGNRLFHVGPDLGIAEGAVVDACLVDQPVEELPERMVAPEPQRILRRRDAPDVGWLAAWWPSTNSRSLEPS
jgi:hypothetical protein